MISTPNTTIDYILLGTDLQGCSNTDTVTVSVIQSLQISSIPSNPTVCQGEEVNINVSGAPHSHGIQIQV